MKTAIIIPARYGSSRFPGKPLAKIAGKTLLQRVFEIGQDAIAGKGGITLAAATEDQRIADYCEDENIPCVMTSENCATGSDRVLEAAEKLGDFDVLLSLQGDALYTPVEAITKMIGVFEEKPDTDVVTPVVPLRWADLDALREQKKTAPFSGTTAVIDKNGKALWFSKNILPAIRKEDRDTEFSPVHQHLGLYGYRTDVLKKFVSLAQGHYEQLEGLEQLRFLENGISIQTVSLHVDIGQVKSGIDTPEDLARAEKFFAA